MKNANKSKKPLSVDIYLSTSKELYLDTRLTFLMSCESDSEQFWLSSSPNSDELEEEPSSQDGSDDVISIGSSSDQNSQDSDQGMLQGLMERQDEEASTDEDTVELSCDSEVSAKIHPSRFSNWRLTGLNSSPEDIKNTQPKLKIHLPA